MATEKETRYILEIEAKVSELSNRIVEYDKKIVELEAKCKQFDDAKTQAYKALNEKDQEITGIHDILDDLGVRGFRDDNKYYRLPLSVRMFAWAVKLAQSKLM